jgi:hypothetical protein
MAQVGLPSVFKGRTPFCILGAAIKKKHTSDRPKRLSRLIFTENEIQNKKTVEGKVTE